MTILEFQPHVDAAITAMEWMHARARWTQGLREEHEAITKALPLAGQYGIEEEPLRARLAQIATEMRGDVTSDRVSLHPVRSIPMDLIAVAVVRRILRLPSECPVLSIKTLPSPEQIAEAVEAIAQRWQHPMGPAIESDEHVASVIG